MYGIKDYVDPVAGKFRVTSGEGHRKAGRTTNGKMMSSFHHGVDIAGATPGSKPPIRNVTAGRVVFVGNAGGWGKTVIVENPDGYRVQYGHLDSFNVKVGDQVTAGQNIGIMGATGNVTGVHLDMIVTKNGKSLRRDGSVLRDAPASIAKRAGGKSQQAATADVPVAPTSVSAMQQNQVTTPEVQAPQPTQVQAPQLADPFAPVQSTNTQGANYGIVDVNTFGSNDGTFNRAAQVVMAAAQKVMGGSLMPTMPLDNGVARLFDTIDTVQSDGYQTSTTSQST